MTDDIHSDGMHARPVVGGVFIKMLTDRRVWKKWASRGQNKVRQIGRRCRKIRGQDHRGRAHCADCAGSWRYTDAKAAGQLDGARFRCHAWKRRPGEFRHGWHAGRSRSHGLEHGRHLAAPRNHASREENFPTCNSTSDHDEDVEIYVNGILASSESGFTTGYVPLEIRPLVLQQLKPGATVKIAVHCHQTTGGQNIDVGLVNVEEMQQ